MKYLIYTKYGEALPLAFWLKRKGHDVAVWILDSRCRKKWDGLIPKAKSYGDQMRKDRLIIFDSCNGGGTADRLKRQGFATWGATSAFDKLALTSLTATPNKDSVIVQGWYEHGGLKFANLIFDYRRELTGDLGVLVTSAGNVCYPVDLKSKLVEELLSPLAVQAQTELWDGCLGVEANVTGDQATTTGFIPKLHFNGLYSLSETVDLSSLFEGDVKPTKKVGASVSINVNNKYSNRIIEFPKEDFDHVFLYDVELDKQTLGAITIGTTRRVLCVTGGGDTVNEATKQMYEVCERLSLSDKGYRLDIGLGIQDRIDTLTKEGWI